jgi:hypothetical protein
MLLKDPQERWTAAKLLAHPFLADVRGSVVAGLGSKSGARAKEAGSSGGEGEGKQDSEKLWRAEDVEVGEDFSAAKKELLDAMGIKARGKAELLTIVKSVHLHQVRTKDCKPKSMASNQSAEHTSDHTPSPRAQVLWGKAKKAFSPGQQSRHKTSPAMAQVWDHVCDLATALDLPRKEVVDAISAADAELDLLEAAGGKGK